nr:hypothetical protein [Tanacetum cinerariifolium]
MNELEQIKKDKEGLDSKLTCFESASKDLDNLLGSHRSNKNKEGLGYNDTITDYSRPSPSIKSNSNDLQSTNSSVSENGESSSSILSNPVIKFVKAVDSPTVININKDETVRKSSVKYVEMYRNTTKSLKGNSGTKLKDSVRTKRSRVMKIPLLEYFATVSAKEFSLLVYFATVSATEFPLLSYRVAPAEEFALLIEDQLNVNIKAD